MKKTYMFVIALLVAMASFSVKANGLPSGIQVSDGTNEYWYYIQSSMVNQATAQEGGRNGLFISSQGSENCGIVSLRNMFLSGNRELQLWKLVDAGTGNYYLVNKATGFKMGLGSGAETAGQSGAKGLMDNGSSKFKDRYYTTAETDATPAEFIFNAGGEEGNPNNILALNSTYPIACIVNVSTIDATNEKRKNGDLIGATASGDFLNVDATASYSDSPKTLNVYGLPGSPRAWIFVPESVMNDKFPKMSTETESHYYKLTYVLTGASLYDNVDNYNTLVVSTDDMGDQALWKLVKYNKVPKVEGDPNSVYLPAVNDSVCFVNKATGRYLNSGSTLDGTPAGFMLQHLAYSPTSSTDYTYSPTNAKTNQFRITAKVDSPMSLRYDQSVTATSMANIVLPNPSDANLKYAWNSGYALYVQPENGSNSLKTTTINKFNAYSDNGYIVVEGAADFQVYTVYGVQVSANTKLTTGTYIVKANGAAKKVFVK